MNAYGTEGTEGINFAIAAKEIRFFLANPNNGMQAQNACAEAKLIYKAATLQPRFVGGEDARSVNSPRRALDQINELVAEQRRANPTLSEAQAFARVYADHPDLAARERLENRPA